MVEELPLRYNGMMQLFAQIAVNIPSVTGVFDYSLPPELAGKIGAGHLVTVPFGRQTVQGVVLELVNQSLRSRNKTRPRPARPAPGPDRRADRTGKANGQVHAQSAGGDHRPDAAVRVESAGRSEIRDQRGQEQCRGKPISGPATQARLLKLLSEKGPLRGRQIDRHFSKVDWRKTAQYLVRSGVLTSQSILPPPTIRPKFVRTAQLAVPPEQAEAALPDLGKTDATRTRRQSALRFLMREPEAVNVAWVYAESGCNLADLQELDERGLIVLRETEIWRDPLEKIESRKQVIRE